MKVWFAVSEAAPFAKTGGLADVAGSLPKALRKLGIDVRVVIPKYSQIPEEYLKKMNFIGYTYVDLTWRREYCGIFSLEHENVPFYFLDNERYFKRDWYYGQPDDGERFTFFCKAVLEVLPVIDFKPYIIHLNDWQTGLVSLLLDAHYRYYRNNGFYQFMHTVMTIHNLKYQGIFPKTMMDEIIGLDWRYFHPDGIEFYDNINFLKAGIAYSTKVTTVSKTYAEEIKTDFYGENLSGILQKRSADVLGILNGIDYEENNPSTDTRIYVPYSLNNIEKKRENKILLQKETGLCVNPETPLIGIVSRLVAQKGMDLIDRMIAELLEMDLQLIVLGTGERKYEDMFLWAQGAFSGKMSANIRYDPVLAQKIYAGCDMFLMPSLFEPCGLGQIFSMRYGTVPIVRETGGLKDTVIPYNEYTNEGTGFTFANYNAHEMKDAVIRAIRVYKDKDKWTALMKRCMQQDFSWERSAREYVNLYDRICRITVTK
ncbi:glycogen/starch synthase, ADP-glucose type [Thermoclostridium stercorarium subsp. stercorarium DSM 8532]|jgi:starch synthase|uniref:Glycogen synthase n=2 Tax=Thermoclostridium stercorarium TaxID=1510 RepID=L7VQ06_THES1|nr:glycogen synthase GlgA [Thermoclostridium stercorarium]AGC67638.1 glycogen/starch synthase, ADP-glucose type [Thermoclostridium stercorarium subsp. stercorarium DSM 8532]AGI38686.1 glycogen synthase [Thermoclostridium stercorarium subsp. stercorarium DSM 8532]ANW98056.1 starch synthase [Thermoclostridium stercorarium subsp. thermolacticum DSM 2910]